MKHLHNNGSNIFTVEDFDTEKYYCKIEIDRNSRHYDLIDVDNIVYNILSVSAINNIFGVRKINFDLKPKAIWSNNNIFKCPYCKTAYISENSSGFCLI